MPGKSSICVLVSGGLDSDVLLGELAVQNKNIWPVYIRQGLAWEKVELYWLRRYLKRIRDLGLTRPPHGRADERLTCGARILNLRVFSLPMRDLYGRHWSTGNGAVPGRRSRDEAVYLPGRNLALSIKAAIFCAMNKIPVLAIGSLSHNPFPDASLSFLRSWGRLLAQGLGRPLRVEAPYRHRSKADVIRRGRHLPLELSFSCMAPKGNFHCGLCNKCAERRRAFKAAGVEDKTIYGNFIS